ncbi:MAG TPA: amidohydrolase family protein [Blastocatellia bacterium]|nr:amidohydrolase family protein [Blastocatellia bacterium]
MSNLKVLNLPTEVQLALEVMPCQANRRVYEPAEKPHPCSYFAEWGVYHSFDYASSGPPPEPGIKQSAIYVGKTNLLPEILSGCRKAPIMCVGINPNLPGFWERSRHAINPLFDDFLQYAHYFRYRSTAKLQMERDEYEELLGDREDSPKETAPLTDFGSAIDVELAEMLMYKSYQSLLDRLAEKQGWNNHKLSVGEDLSYANMVACPSAKWVVNAQQSDGGKLPVMGLERMRGIVGECFHERRYFLRQLFQSLPVALFVFSVTTARPFITAMSGKFIKGDPQPGETLEALLSREIRLGYGATSDGEELSARVIFSPHASANQDEFLQFKERMAQILSEEVDAGRLVFNQQTGHLARPRGGCVFCGNALYRIGPCDYERELKPLAEVDAEETFLAAEEGAGSVLKENEEQERLLNNFLGPDTAHGKTGITPSGAALLSVVEAASAAVIDAASLLNVDELDSPPCVLRGRVVTMDNEFTVIEDGSLYLQKGRIVAVREADAAAPSGFPDDAPVIETGGTIYPGLLDLHNHLAYNITTLWKPPRKFKNRSEWQRNPSYAENVKMPLDVLTSDTKTARAIVRYVEVKALLGGATSVQGVRSKFTSLPVTKYAGVVRNFERTDDEQLPEASGRIRDLNINDEVQVESFRRALATYKAYFYHLSEGIGDTTRKQYLDLKEADLLEDSLLAIHALDLEEEDFQKLQVEGCKVVWSPMSNCLLYGQTVDAKRLAESSVPFALGCDWSPSGSKNLLEELKVAWLMVQADGAELTFRDLCAAVTCQAANIVGWGEALGVIKNGKLADLVVIAGVDGDPYEKLVRATEREVALVIINGHARYGDKDIIAEFGFPATQLEAITVGGKAKRLHLMRQGDPLEQLSFSKASDILHRSMSRLRELDADLTSSAFELAPGEEPFQLELDNDDFTGLEGFAEALAATIELPESIELDVPTVIDDPNYFGRLGEIEHLPEALKQLRDFYLS